MKEVRYEHVISDTDIIRIYFRKDKAQIRHFVVSYLALIEGRWRSIMRIDTCHGYPHKHTFYLTYKEFVLRLEGNLNFLFNQAKQNIIRDYRKIKDNFLRR